MAPAAAKTLSEDSGLSFKIGSRIYSLDAAKVIEVIRRPSITRVPHGPAVLAGIANLRGVAMPIIAASRLLDLPETDRLSGEKVIVFDHQGPVGLLVDDVLSFGSVVGSSQRIAELENKLDLAFRPSQQVRAPRLSAAAMTAEAGSEAAQLISLVCFRVAGQMFALPVESAHEVLAMPAECAALPGTDAAVAGVIDLRGGIVPIISLARLLGLDAGQGKQSPRIVVTEFEGSLIGLAVESLDAIRRLPRTSIDPVPEILKRGSGPAEIESIGRGGDGRTLISILSVSKLFGNAVVRQAVGQNFGATSMSSENTSVAHEQFLIFKLGDESYGLPIADVDEVVRVPEAVTRMPNAPSFVTGVMNLRGKPIPLIDQRLRFDAPETHVIDSKPRAIILTIGQLQAGFIVDSAAEVVNVAASALLAAPEFSSDQTEVFGRVAHIEADGRMILIVDPKELLTRAERDIVAALAEGNPMAPAE